MRRNIYATTSTAIPKRQLRFSEKISFSLCSWVHATATLEKGCSNHTVNSKSSCQLLPRFQNGGPSTTCDTNKTAVLKHMAIHDLPNTRKESSKTGCVCNNKGKVQWSKLKFPANTGFDGLNLCGESSPHQKWQWSSGPPNELAHLAMCSCVAESFSVSSAQNLEKSWHCGIHVRYGSFIEILIMSRLRPNTYNSITSWCSPAKHSPYWLGQCKDNVSKRLAVRMSELPKNVWTNKSGGKSRNVVCCGTLTWSDFMGIG